VFQPTTPDPQDNVSFRVATALLVAGVTRW